MPTITPVNPATQVIQTGASAERPAASETPQATAPAVVTPEQPAMSPQLAALARKERVVRQMVRDAQAKEEALKAFQGEIDSAKAWKEQLRSDPWSVLTGAGLTPEQVTQVILNQPKPEDLKFTELQREIQALKTEQENSVKRQTEAQAQAYQQAKTQIAAEVKLLVEGDEAFDTIKAMKAEDAVVELIERNFEATKQIMSVEDAAKVVEAYLEEQAFEMTKLKKIQARLAPAPAAPAQKLQAPQKLPMQTLSNRDVQTAAQPTSARERRERAILAFQGKL